MRQDAAQNYVQPPPRPGSIRHRQQAGSGDKDDAAAAAKAATEAFASETGANGPDELPEWLALAAKLPASRGDRVVRGQLYDGMLEGTESALTVARLERELLSAIGVPSESALAQACAPAISRAIETSKDIRGGAEEGTVDRADFRIAVAYLRRHFELLALYGIKGPSDARQLDMAAFETAIPTLMEWGVSADKPSEAFASIPGQRNGAVPFDAFADWALRRGLEPLAADADEEAAESPAPSRSPPPPPKHSPSRAKKARPSFTSRAMGGLSTCATSKPAAQQQSARLRRQRRQQRPIRSWAMVIQTVSLPPQQPRRRRNLAHRSLLRRRDHHRQCRKCRTFHLLDSR